MLLHIPNVLSPDQLALCRERLERADWSDGKITAGYQSAKAKRNQQLPEHCPEAQELGALVLSALEKNPLFIAAALPARIFPPLFNKYAPGMQFGAHVDNAIRQVPKGPRIRTDISATLFLTGPEDYEGGELVIEDSFGNHSVKLPAGDMVIYPASSLHHVTAVSEGCRVASFFWIESMVRSAADRALLFDMDLAIQDLHRAQADHPALIRLTGCYHNLLRRWATP